MPASRHERDRLAARRAARAAPRRATPRAAPGRRSRRAGNPKRAASLAVTRVSSQKIASASARALPAARGEIVEVADGRSDDEEAPGFRWMDSRTRENSTEARCGHRCARHASCASALSRLSRSLVSRRRRRPRPRSSTASRRPSTTRRSRRARCASAMVVSALEPGAGESAEAFRARVLEALIEQHLEYEDAARFGPAPPDARRDRRRPWRSLRERLKAEGKDPDAEFARGGHDRGRGARLARAPARDRALPARAVRADRLRRRGAGARGIREALRARAEGGGRAGRSRSTRSPRRCAGAPRSGCSTKRSPSGSRSCARRRAISHLPDPGAVPENRGLPSSLSTAPAAGAGRRLPETAPGGPRDARLLARPGRVACS